MAGPAAGIRTPFPGLRPFRESDAEFFFGQEEQQEALLNRLGSAHFVAVIGTSGCGKSSLVRAGTLPVLRKQKEKDGHKRWHIAITNPGPAPIARLARSLAGLELGRTFTPEECETILRKHSLGLLEFLRTAEIPAQQRLLVFVDQFEEIFRFRRRAATPAALDESALYVKLLLDAAHEPRSPIYVVTTMRSEYLEDCSEFYGLGEAMNRGLFLLPRMTRCQCEEAIVAPIESEGASIDAGLVHQLLTETEERDDGLPLLQHALRRIWCHSRKKEEGANLSLSAHDFRTPATLLNDHLDGIYGRLDKADKVVARYCFTLLSEWDSKGKETRRTATVRDLMDVSGADLATVRRVVNAFRNEELGRTFLRIANADEDLDEVERDIVETDTLDLSHECLMRLWAKLREWMMEEYEHAERFRSLGCAAKDKEAITGLRLARFVGWRDKFKPTRPWARRYSVLTHPVRGSENIDLDVSLAHLSRNEKKAKGVQLIIFAAGALMAILLVSAAITNYLENVAARDAERRALKAQVEAEANRAEAVRQEVLANEQSQQAEKAKNEAIAAQRETLLTVNKLQSALVSLQAAKKELERQRLAAVENAREANQQRLEAVMHQEEAETFRDKLDQQLKDELVLRASLAAANEKLQDQERSARWQAAAEKAVAAVRRADADMASPMFGHERLNIALDELMKLNLLRTKEGVIGKEAQSGAGEVLLSAANALSDSFVENGEKFVHVSSAAYDPAKNVISAISATADSTFRILGRSSSGESFQPSYLAVWHSRAPGWMHWAPYLGRSRRTDLRTEALSRNGRAVGLVNSRGELSVSGMSRSRGVYVAPDFQERLDKEGIAAISFDGEGKLLAAITKDKLTLLDLTKGTSRVIRPSLPRGADLKNVSLSADGKSFVVQSGLSDALISHAGKIYTFRNPRPAGIHSALAISDKGVAAMPNAAGSCVEFIVPSAGTTQADLAPADPALCFGNLKIRWLGFGSNGDGGVLAAISDSGEAKIWVERQDGSKFIEKLALKHSGAGEMSASLSRDARFLTTHSTDGTVRVWNLRRADANVDGTTPAEMLSRLRALGQAPTTLTGSGAQVIADWVARYRSAVQTPVQRKIRSR